MEPLYPGGTKTTLKLLLSQAKSGSGPVNEEEIVELVAVARLLPGYREAMREILALTESNQNFPAEVIAYIGRIAKAVLKE